MKEEALTFAFLQGMHMFTEQPVDVIYVQQRLNESIKKTILACVHDSRHGAEENHKKRALFILTILRKISALN